jgi:hypothetical protein
MIQISPAWLHRDRHAISASNQFRSGTFRLLFRRVKQMVSDDLTSG